VSRAALATVSGRSENGSRSTAGHVRVAKRVLSTNHAEVDGIRYERSLMATPLRFEISRLIYDARRVVWNFMRRTV